MSRASKRPKSNKTAKLRPSGRRAEAAPRVSPGRQAGLVACVGLLTVFLGGLTGAHMALSNVPADFMPAARTVEPPAGGARGLAEVALATGAVAPNNAPKRAAEPEEPSEADMARIYEEPLELALRDLGDLNQVAREPARVQLASLPGSNIANLVPVRRPPLWQRYAVPVSVKAGQPMIAIVLDDVGLSRSMTRRAIQLPGPLTLSFMTYAKGLRQFANDARAAGHELMLHVPMEPKDASYDPGPKVLRSELSKDEIARRLEWGLKRFEGYVGINNHMGSKFTAARQGMSQVMRELRARDLLFLDSVTSANSIAWKVAERSGVPFARRDVFLDHDWRDATSIQNQLAILERIARRRGYAVGIGHPHRLTLEILSKWLPEARQRGIALVPISAIVSRRTELAQGATGSAGSLFARNRRDNAAGAKAG